MAGLPSAAFAKAGTDGIVAADIEGVIGTALEGIGEAGGGIYPAMAAIRSASSISSRVVVP